MTRADRTRASIDAIDRQILSVGAGALAMSGESLIRLVGNLRVHAAAVRNARAQMLTIRGPVWRSVEVVMNHLETCCCPLALDRFESLLPRAENTRGSRGPDEASVIDYADLVAMIFAWEAAVGRQAVLRTAIKKRLAGVAAACMAGIATHIELANDADIPDFRQLGREILRAEVAGWAFEVAGAPEHAAAILQRANRAARQAMTWAARVFERFRSNPDELSHFDAAATLTAVDHLLVVILRVRDGDRTERETGSHPFVLTIGEQALQEFVTGLSHMTGRYLQIAEQHLFDGGASGSFVVSVLRVLDRILRVAHLLVPVVQKLDTSLNYGATVTRMQAMRGRLLASLAGSEASRDQATRLAILDKALRSIGA